jgi:hypothetical protein
MSHRKKNEMKVAIFRSVGLFRVTEQREIFAKVSNVAYQRKIEELIFPMRYIISYFIICKLS